MSKDKIFKNPRTKKLLPSILAVALVIVVTAGITLAVLTARSGGVVNTFTPAKVTIDIEENFDGEQKKDVKIPNTGTTAAYIRAAIVITWQDSDGKVYAVKPVEDVDYTFVRSDNGWFQSDGYWYWKSPVAPGAKTGNLIDSITWIKDCVNNAYSLNVEILAQAIQAQGSSEVGNGLTPAVTQAWGVQVDADGNLKP